MKINAIIIGIFLVSILVLNGCNSKEGRLEVDSLNPTEISYSQYGTNAVPIEFTIKNIGDGTCKINRVSMNTFWASPDDYGTIYSQDVPTELIPNQRHTFVLRGFIPQALRGVNRAQTVTFIVDTDQDCLPQNLGNYGFERVINFVE